MKAEELDRKFDDGEEVLEHFDVSAMKRPGLEISRVNVDFPQWMIKAIEREAQRLGVQSQAVIKVWIAERLDEDDRLISEEPGILADPNPTLEELGGSEPQAQDISRRRYDI